MANPKPRQMPSRAPRVSEAFTPEMRAFFLTRIRLHARVTQACEETGISLSTYSSFVTPSHPHHDPDFAKGVEEGRQSYADWLEREVERRAVRGWLEPVFTKEGKIAGHVRKFSDRLLELHIKRHRKDYREKTEVELHHTGGILPLAPNVREMMGKLSPEGRKALRVVLGELQSIQRENAAAIALGEEPPAAATPGLPPIYKEAIAKGARMLSADLEEADRLDREGAVDAEWQPASVPERDLMRSEPEPEGRPSRERNPARDPMDPRDVEMLHQGLDDDEEPPEADG